LVNYFYICAGKYVFFVFADHLNNVQLFCFRTSIISCKQWQHN